MCWRMARGDSYQRDYLDGGEIIADTNPNVGPYRRIDVITAATLSAYSGNVDGTMTGVAFPVNFSIRGETDSFTLSGGSVIAYRM